MKTANEIWDALGALSEDELFHVITRLFAFYEGELQRDPDSREARLFFRNLAAAITQTGQCNSNRR
ncbi:hypothetical protein ACUUL3_11650 [Thiovibrio sp. JS02]